MTQDRPRRVTQINTTQDMARFAAMVRHAGDLLESSGWRALYVTGTWEAGPPSANLEPHRGWRSEEIEYTKGGEKEVVPIPSDSTGEAILKPDPLAGDHDDLVALMDRMARDADDLIYLLRKAVPSPEAVLHPDDLTPAQVSAAGWCTSCWQDGNYHEPVAMRPNGERRYRDSCVWCGEFIAANKIKPPLELIEARHRGQRITASLVAQALANVDKGKAEAKKQRKVKRRKKAA